MPDGSFGNIEQHFNTLVETGKFGPKGEFVVLLNNKTYYITGQPNNMEVQCAGKIITPTATQRQLFSDFLAKKRTEQKDKLGVGDNRFQVTNRMRKEAWGKEAAQMNKAGSPTGAVMNEDGDIVPPADLAA